MKATQVTPLLTVDRIEPCLEFWTKNFGFEVLATVPHGDAVGFVMLKSGPVELMYQSRDSLREDLPLVVDNLGASMLYFDLESLDPVRAKAASLDQVLPERTTFYGRTEIVLRDPAGHYLVFSTRTP